MNAARLVVHFRRIYDVGGKGVTIERDWSAAVSTSDGALVLLAPPLTDTPDLPRPIAPEDLNSVKKSLSAFGDEDARLWLDTRDNGDRELAIGAEGEDTVHCPLRAPYRKHTGWLPQAGVEQIRTAVDASGKRVDHYFMGRFKKRYGLVGRPSDFPHLWLTAPADADTVSGLSFMRSPSNSSPGYHGFEVGEVEPYDAPTALHFPPKHFARLVKLRRGAEVEVLPEHRLLVLRRDDYLYVLRGHRWGERPGKVWPLQRPV